MGESGRLPERFAAAFLFCPQRRISGAFRTPHRGLRFVIALANTTSISCGRFRAFARNFALRLPTLRPIFVSADRLFSFSLLCPLPIRQVSICGARHDEYSKALARTLASFRPPRTTFSFYTFLSQGRCFALRLPTLRLIFVSADRLFSFSLLCPLPIRQVSICGARHDEYSKALARTFASFRPPRTTFFFYTFLF